MTKCLRMKKRVRMKKGKDEERVEAKKRPSGYLTFLHLFFFLNLHSLFRVILVRIMAMFRLK